MDSPSSASEAAAAATSTTKVFPVPQVVLTIFCPKVFTTTEDKVAQHVAWKRYSLSGNSSNSQRIKIKLSSMLLRMLNKFVEEQMLPKEAIQIFGGLERVMFVQVLCSSSILPTLIKRCERIGIGTAVGSCYATLLETSNIPAPGTGLDAALGPMEVLNSMSKHSSHHTSTTNLSSMTQHLEYEPTPGRELDTVAGRDDDDKSAVTLTLDDDILGDDGGLGGDNDNLLDSNDDDKNKSSVTEAISVPFISNERIQELRRRIIDARKEWLQTASTVRVEQVAEQVRANAACTYDYLMYVLCAATVAAIGLGTDSSITTIASMLISPIMGPVMGFTFGTTIRKMDLILVSLRNELFSLFICVVVGGFWGIMAAISNAPQKRGWPTGEMLARGDKFGLATGVLIALPSGVATALSTLGNNSSGMTGVAISLSLLPPAVNAGMCWMYAVMLNAPGIEPNEGDDTDYVEKGNISIALTLVNIICIWIAGIFAFWLKEIAPVKKKNAFWLRDVNNYRQQMKRRMATTNPDVINDGVQAALELRQELGADILEDDFSIGLMHDGKRISAARRGALAANALEDAFFLDQDFGMDGKIFAGGLTARSLSESTLGNIKLRKNRRKSVSDLIENANQFGGMSSAGEALFDDKLMGTMDEISSLPSDADGVDHDGVAQKILLEKND